MVTTAVATMEMETETDITEAVIMEMVIAPVRTEVTNVIMKMTTAHPGGAIIALPTPIQTVRAIRTPLAPMISHGGFTETTIPISHVGIPDMTIPNSHVVFIRKTVTPTGTNFMTTEVDGCGALERFAIDARVI